MAADIRTLLGQQDGVVSRQQALASGLAPHDVRRLLRRRDWVTVHPGVYIAHTGPLTWSQRAWAAVLWAWPAALWGRTSLAALERPAVPTSPEPLHVVVNRHRSGLRPPAGVVVHHAGRLDTAVLWNASPPRTRVEEAALDAATSASEVEAVAVLSRCIQRRWTTSDRLILALSRRGRIPRRRWMSDVLADLGAGTCSVLEHGFLSRVERPHRLPRAERQRPAWSSQGLVYRDADYGPVLVELDGRLFHDSALARDRDLERDLDAAVDGRASLRLGWGQVFDRPCSTAMKLAVVMRLRGVDLKPQPCGPSCAIE